MLLRSLKSSFVIVLACLSLSINAADNRARLTLTGDSIQGGMMIGQATHDIASVLIGEVKIPLHPNKRLFVFGFGRDAKAEDKLTVEFADGSVQEQALRIEQREYKVDRVEGVASKYVSPPQSVLDRIRAEGQAVKDARALLSYRVDFTQPVVQPADGRISGVYGSQRVFNGVPKRPHFGMDIAAPIGTPVVAPWAGKVVLAESDLYYSGGTLIIDHGLGITSTYIHLNKLHVKAGDEVTQGQNIAEIGATGRVTGPHLDWRLNWFARRLDPQLLLK